jgi:hypothetical protein
MGFKDYFHPVDKDAAPKKPEPAAMAPPRSVFPDTSFLSSMKLHSKKSPAPFAASTVDNSSTPPSPSSLYVTSHHASPKGPGYPNGDFRNGAATQLMDIKADVMVNWLHHQQQERMWTNYGWDEGVILKKARDDYVCCPSDMLQHADGFYNSVKKLNVKVSPRVICARTTADLYSPLCLSRRRLSNYFYAELI